MTIKLFALSLFTAAVCFGLPSAQDEYEKKVQTVVRNKIFYKADKLEIGVHGGMMPYDTLINHYMVGGRATWHLADHYAWEIIDAQYAFPTVSSYTTSLVSTQGIQNLQTQQIKMMLGTDFLLSPVYGKFRFFGATQIFFDMYLVVGGGVANTDTLKVAAAGTGQPAVQSIVRSNWDPMATFGLGFKVFFNRAMGVYFDMRDYVVISQVYGSTAVKSNYSIFVGLSFFLPTF